MKVLKRDGSFEDVSFDKVLRRIQCQCKDLTGVDSHSIAQKVCSRIYDGVKTSELDELAAQMCASLVTEHPDYGVVASRLIVSNHQKNTSPSFSETMSILYNAYDIHNVHTPRISEELWNIVQSNKEKLNSVLEYDRDFNFDYFGFKTLERSYLIKVNGKVVERPQHMWMRVALGIHGWDVKDAIETYQLMSTRHFTHATPTLFNAGTPRPQLSSCFLVGMESDSINGIFSTLTDIAEISKNAGGIGLHIHQIRATGSHIRGTNGESTGIIPMLRVFNATARYVNQGGKRNGSIAVYLEPSHPDFEKFLDIRKNHGNMEERCLDLFTAAWLPDLFMKRVEANEMWSFFCPDECPGLADVYGDEYEALYHKYESEGKAKRTMKAQQLFMAIVRSQIETGTPYILYKDAANHKSNQKNLGTIKSSNLCSEILEYSSPEETAVCNLASIALPTFIDKDENGVPSFNLEKLHKVTQVITKNLCKVIDRNFYPTPKCERSNMRHRPIGIGVQGLADTYAIMRFPFDSPEAADLNQQIFETIYHGALTASMTIAKKRGELRDEYDAPNTTPERKEEIMTHLNLTEEEEKMERFRGAYTTFEGSPAQQGVLQFDLWNQKPYGRWDWDTLKQDIMKYGLRNSLLLAPMPTASTSQILGFNECFEPFTSNIYQRRTLAGEFTIINKYLIRDLLDIGLWSVEMKNRILLGNGSIQHVKEIPQWIRDLYKTAWELKQRVLIDQAADRGIYICQTQSLNLFVEDPDFNRLSNMHFYSWKKGLKTGIYYLRTRPKAKTIAFSIDASEVATSTTLKEQESEPILACTRDNPNCTMCSS